MLSNKKSRVRVKGGVKLVDWKTTDDAIKMPGFEVTIEMRSDISTGLEVTIEMPGLEVTMEMPGLKVTIEMPGFEMTMVMPGLDVTIERYQA